MTRIDTDKNKIFSCNPCSSVAKTVSLSRLALFEQQVVSLDDDFVARSEPIDDFHAVVVLNSRLHLTLLVTITVCHEDNRLSLVVENC